jgi:hypothetical protein
MSEKINKKNDISKQKIKKKRFKTNAIKNELKTRLKQWQFHKFLIRKID